MIGKIIIQTKLSIPEGVAFHHWLPVGQDSEITLKIDNEHSLRIYADQSCTHMYHKEEQFTPESWETLTLNYLYFEHEINSSDAGLLKYLESVERRDVYNETDAYNKDFESQYYYLGEKVKEVNYRFLSKIIDFYKLYYGQNHLPSIKLDVLDSTAKLDQSDFTDRFKLVESDVSKESKWRHWDPFRKSATTISMSSVDQNIVCQGESWKQLAEYLKNNKKSNLILELISNSVEQYRKGHYRSCIIEVISALEVAIDRFFKQPLISFNKLSDTLKTFDISTRENNLNHSLGFEKTVRYLLPIILDERYLMAERYSQVLEAIQKRNSIVHHGSRIEDSYETRASLQSTIDLALTLMRLTENDDNNHNILRVERYPLPQKNVFTHFDH